MERSQKKEKEIETKNGRNANNVNILKCLHYISLPIEAPIGQRETLFGI